jgi:hypothetical protein
VSPLFYSLFLFTLFVQAFSLSFLALFSHPFLLSTSSLYLVPLPRPSTSSLHLLFPPPTSTSSIRLTVVLAADLSENRALIFSSPKLCPAKFTPLALTFC